MQKLENLSIHESSKNRQPIFVKSSFGGDDWINYTVSIGQENCLIAEIQARHKIDGTQLATGWPTQATTAQEADQIAALITAAPDLLDVLKRIVNHNGKPTNSMFFDAVIAIDKAEGK